ncbi:MAG: hypothetical protein IJ681_10710 [Bacteroidales bacterium]|nr:hypothetical protein [Bacteroidales bacterium]
MINSIKNTLAVLLICIVASVMTGCERDFSDQDNDFIAGKWRNAKTLALEKFKETDMMAYTEYAPYSFIYDKRTVKTISYEYDSTQLFPYMRTTRVGHYTLNGDSLIVKDYKLQTHNYVIVSIKDDIMIYKDQDDSVYTYVRYDGALDVGKMIQDMN